MTTEVYTGYLNVERDAGNKLTIKEYVRREPHKCVNDTGGDRCDICFQEISARSDQRLLNAHYILNLQGFRSYDFNGIWLGPTGTKARVESTYETHDIFGRPYLEEDQVYHISYTTNGEFPS